MIADMHHLHHVCLRCAECDRLPCRLFGRGFDVNRTGISNPYYERRTISPNNPSLPRLTPPSQSRHVALIGDHKQLPPVITSREAQAMGLGTSLFERLTKEGGLFQ